MSWPFVVGVDEVGRGALAGPLYAVAACFSTPDDTCPIPGVKDSKKFSDKDKMRAVFDRILRHSSLRAVGWGISSSDEINRFGVDGANSLAFKRAVMQVVEELGRPPDKIIIDGMNPVPGLPVRNQVVLPKADALHWQVSAASIIAKVLRDEQMWSLAEIYPGYGFEHNCGYHGAGDEHPAAIRTLGPTPEHRTKFISNIMKGRTP